MRLMSFIAFVAIMHASSAIACSIDALKKIADDHLERLYSRPERQFTDTDPDPDDSKESIAFWQLFENENGTPHSIVIRQENEVVEFKVRMSLLNRRDFVIVETQIIYDFEKEPSSTKKYLINPPSYYFYCNNKLQIPTGVSNAHDVAAIGEEWRKAFFEADDLKPELARVPE